MTMTKCPRCFGKGVIPHPIKDGMKAECPRCSGAGKIKKVMAK